MVSVHPQPRLLNYSLEGVKIKVEISLLNLIHGTMKWAGVFDSLIGIHNYFGEFLFSICFSLAEREISISFRFLYITYCAWSLPTPEYASLLEMRRLFLDNTNLTGQLLIFPHVVFCVTNLTFFRTFSLAPSELDCRFLFAQQIKRCLTSTKYTFL